MTVGRVTITIDERSFDATVEALVATGMTNVHAHREIGIVTADVADVEAVLAIPGVIAMEPAHQVRLPPPDADVQ